MSENRIIRLVKDYDYVLVFLLLVAVSLVLMARTSYYQSSRLIAWTNSVAGEWYSGVNSVGGYFGLKAENDRLAAENALLRAQMESSYISFSDREFEVNDTVYLQRYSYTEARVIKNSWSQQNNYIMIRPHPRPRARHGCHFTRRHRGRGDVGVGQLRHHHARAPLG